MARFVVQHPFVVGAILVSGPLAYCVGAAVLGWINSGARGVAFPVLFIALWLAYMTWWVFALFKLTKADRRRKLPVAPPRSNRLRQYFSPFDPHSN